MECDLLTASPDQVVDYVTVEGRGGGGGGRGGGEEGREEESLMQRIVCCQSISTTVM